MFLSMDSRQLDVLKMHLNNCTVLCIPLQNTSSWCGNSLWMVTVYTFYWIFFSLKDIDVFTLPMLKVHVSGQYHCFSCDLIICQKAFCGSIRNSCLARNTEHSCWEVLFFPEVPRQLWNTVPNCNSLCFRNCLVDYKNFKWSLDTTF